MAGEPGAGKTTGIDEPLHADGIALIIRTDELFGHTARHYRRELRCAWQRWKLELDEPSNRSNLDCAFRKAMEEDYGAQIDGAQNIVVEGVFSGHPVFRDIAAIILQQLGFHFGKVRSIALVPRRARVIKNIEGRKNERKNECDLDFVMQRSKDYRKRLGEQTDISCFESTPSCLQAARDFLQ